MDIAADSAEVLLVERGEVALGDALDLQLGHDGESERVFTGNVVALRPSITGVSIWALGTAVALLNTRIASFYENQTIGAIVRDLVGQAGLSTGTIDEGPLLPRFTVDGRQSVYAHLRELAQRIGCELYSDRNGKMVFRALGSLGGLGGAVGAVGGLPGGSGVGYTFGQHLLAAGADVRPVAWGTIDVGGESPVSGQGTSTAHWLTTNDTDYRGSAGTDAPKRLILDPAARTKDLADTFAKGRLVVAGRRAHQIEVAVLGQPQVDLGDTIDVAGLADALINKSGYVCFIRHHFDAQRGFVSTLRIVVT
ncbi:MAG TPA: hypothetical protein VGD69_13835 [Herpetosiphonaceae bacterium]